MKTLLLCDSLTKALELLRAVGQVDGLRVHVLVCNNGGRPRARFYVGLARQMVKAGAGGCRMLAALLCGRLRLNARHVHHPASIRWLRQQRFDVALHAMSVIYRRPLLDCFRLGVLNAHIGILPAYRGRAVMEWSLLHGDATGITTFFIDEGIDTGPRIVLREKIPVTGHQTIEAAKESLFACDARMYATALARLLQPEFVPQLQHRDEGRRYFVMSRMFQDVVTARLQQQVGDRPSPASPRRAAA